MDSFLFMTSEPWLVNKPTQYFGELPRLKSKNTAETLRSKDTLWPPFWIFATRETPPYHDKSTRYHQHTTQNGNKNLPNMPKYQCPFPECTYETEDVEDALAAVLISVHSNGTHMPAPTNSNAATQHTNAAKIEKVRRPKISAAGSSEECSYFLTRWQEYVDATKVSGKDKVIQLLERCDENLRKDITRNAGGSLANKTVDYCTYWKL